MPAHSRSALILSATECATSTPAPYDGTRQQTVKGSRKRVLTPEGQDALKMYCSAANQGVDFGVFWKPAELFFGESEPTIDGDFENTGNPFDELDFFRASLHKPCPRTEGSWFIVSGHAVFDSDLHYRHL